jgi:hypothetical protein
MNAAASSDVETRRTRRETRTPTQAGAIVARRTCRWAGSIAERRASTNAGMIDEACMDAERSPASRGAQKIVRDLRPSQSGRGNAKHRGSGTASICKDATTRDTATLGEKRSEQRLRTLESPKGERAEATLSSKHRKVTSSAKQASPATAVTELVVRASCTSQGGQGAKHMHREANLCSLTRSRGSLGELHEDRICDCPGEHGTRHLADDCERDHRKMQAPAKIERATS